MQFGLQSLLIVPSCSTAHGGDIGRVTPKLEKRTLFFVASQGQFEKEGILVGGTVISSSNGGNTVIIEELKNVLLFLFLVISCEIPVLKQLLCRPSKSTL